MQKPWSTCYQLLLEGYVEDAACIYPSFHGTHFFNSTQFFILHDIFICDGPALSVQKKACKLSPYAFVGNKKCKYTRQGTLLKNYKQVLSLSEKSRSIQIQWFKNPAIKWKSINALHLKFAMSHQVKFDNLKETQILWQYKCYEEINPK